MKAILSKWLSEEIEYVSSINKYFHAWVELRCTALTPNWQIVQFKCLEFRYSIFSNLGAHSHHTGREVK